MSQEVHLPYSLAQDTTGFTTLHPLLPDAAHNTISSPHAPLIHPTFTVPVEYYPYLFPTISYTQKEGTLRKTDWVSMGAKCESHHTLNLNMALITPAC